MCGAEGIFECTGCGEQAYCSSRCQRVHWAQHSAVCKALRKTPHTALSAPFSDPSLLSPTASISITDIASSSAQDHSSQRTRSVSLLTAEDKSMVAAIMAETPIQRGQQDIANEKDSQALDARKSIHSQATAEDSNSHENDVEEIVLSSRSVTASKASANESLASPPTTSSFVGYKAPPLSRTSSQAASTLGTVLEETALIGAVAVQTPAPAPRLSQTVIDNGEGGEKPIRIAPEQRRESTWRAPWLGGAHKIAPGMNYSLLSCEFLCSIFRSLSDSHSFTHPFTFAYPFPCVFFALRLLKVETLITAEHIGKRVRVRGYCDGTLRFLGSPHESQSGIWLGIELDRPIGKVKKMELESFLYIHIYVYCVCTLKCIRWNLRESKANLLDTLCFVNVHPILCNHASLRMTVHLGVQGILRARRVTAYSCRYAPGKLHSLMARAPPGLTPIAVIPLPYQVAHPLTSWLRRRNHSLALHLPEAMMKTILACSLRLISMTSALHPSLQRFLLPLLPEPKAQPSKLVCCNSSSNNNSNSNNNRNNNNNSNSNNNSNNSNNQRERRSP